MTDAALLDDLRRAEVPTPSHKDAGAAGVVTAAGTPEHWLNLWVSLHALRDTGCGLPIEVFHLPDERPFDLPLPDGVEVRALEVSGLSGWAVKPWALWTSRFDRCFWLDVDNVPLVDPTPWVEAASTPWLWPDAWRSSDRGFIEALGADPDEPEAESGQLVWPTVDFAAPLWAACRLNRDHRDAVYQRVHGDKDTFRLGCAALEVPFRWVSPSAWPVGDHAVVMPIPGTVQRLQLRASRGAPREVGLVQRGPDGELAFVHRTVVPWQAFDARPTWRWVEHRASPRGGPPLSSPPSPTDVAPAVIADVERRWLGRLAAERWFVDQLGLHGLRGLWERHRYRLESLLAVPFGGAPSA